MYKPLTTLNDYVNFTVDTNCFGKNKIKIDSDKIEEFHEQCIKEISEKFSVNIDLIKLIDSKIIVTDSDVLKKLHNYEIKNKRLINMFQTDDNITNIKNLNNQIISIMEYIKSIYVNNEENYFNINQVILDNYNKVINLKLNEEILKNFELNLENIYNYIKQNIKNDELLIYSLIIKVFTLNEDQILIIKNRNELKLKLKIEEIITKEILPNSSEIEIKELNLSILELQKNIQDKETNLFLIIDEKNRLEKENNQFKNFIYQMNENMNKKLRDCDTIVKNVHNDLSNILQENNKLKSLNIELENEITGLKINGERASMELLDLMAERDNNSLSEKNKELIEMNKELLEKNEELNEKMRKTNDDDVEFFNVLIRRASIYEL